MLPPPRCWQPACPSVRAPSMAVTHWKKKINGISGQTTKSKTLIPETVGAGEFACMWLSGLFRVSSLLSACPFYSFFVITSIHLLCHQWPFPSLAECPLTWSGLSPVFGKQRFSRIPFDVPRKVVPLTCGRRVLPLVNAKEKCVFLLHFARLIVPLCPKKQTHYHYH